MLSRKRIEALVEPTVLLLGCQPLVPYHGTPEPQNGPPYRIKFDTEPGDHPWPHDRCPTCGGLHRRGVDCAWCALPERGRMAVAMGKAATEAYQLRVYQCQQEVDRLAEKRPLTETERRHVARKYGAAGVAFLRSIGQLPDWDLRLDTYGRQVATQPERPRPCPSP
jgi:hypothetical protein